MKKVLFLMLLFMTLSLNACYGMLDNEDWGYLGGSEMHGEGGHRGSSEYDD